MNYKDYKFWFIRRDDNGFITEAGIRFFEGEYRDVEKTDIGTDEKTIVNEYRRINRLSKMQLNDIKPKMIKQANENEAVRYLPEDFGQIKTDDELRLFLNKQLAKIKGYKAIDEQKCQH